jgi:hypothetical protein
MTDLSNAVAVGVSVPVYVNHGRWVVMCPSCLSAEIGDRVAGRFMCHDCRNSDHGGMWITVDWPEDADAIDELLNARPDRLTRNWLPHETVADLAAENETHGIGP